MDWSTAPGENGERRRRRESEHAVPAARSPTPPLTRGRGHGTQATNRHPPLHPVIPLLPLPRAPPPVTLPFPGGPRSPMTASIHTAGLLAGLVWFFFHVCYVHNGNRIWPFR